MHAVQVTVQIPKLKNWNRRAEVLKARKIEFTPIVQGQRIMFKGMKTWLCNTSIVMYVPYSWFADTSAAALEKATTDVISLIKSLEKYLGAASFKIRDGYRFKFSKQEHALVKNALAQQYNEKKLKLRVFDDSGLWLLIDDSFDLEELEAVHPKTSPDDHRKVQDFFNSLKRNPIKTEDVTGMRDFMRDQLAPSLEAQAEQNAALARNIELHLEVMGNINNGISELRGTLDDIKGLGSGERAKTGHSGPSGERLEEISEMLSVLVQDKIKTLEPEQREGLEKFTGSERTVEVEILGDLPRFLVQHRGAIKAIGPFSPGARIYLDEDVARILIKNETARTTGENIA